MWWRINVSKGLLNHALCVTPWTSSCRPLGLSQNTLLWQVRRVLCVPLMNKEVFWSRSCLNFEHFPKFSPTQWLRFLAWNQPVFPPVPLLFWSSLLRFISLYPIHFLTEMNCVKGEDTKKHVFLQWCSLSHKSTLALRLMPSFKHPVIDGSWDLTVQWVPAGPGFTAPHRNAWTIWHSNWSLQIYRSSCTTAETTPPCSSTA